MDFKALLRFLKQLKANNSKEWFDANRKEYESLRKEFLGFVGDTITAIGSVDKGLLSLDPKKCVFRINRDIRFSADKSPYKTNFGINLNPAGKGEEFCGFYLHIEPGNSFFAAGVYMPQPQSLAAIRQEIDYNFPAFKKIVDAKSFKAAFGKLSGDKLSRPPKGYDAENPAIEYLKHKSFIVQVSLSEKELLDPALLKNLTRVSKDMMPLVSFLRVALSGS